MARATDSLVATLGLSTDEYAAGWRQAERVAVQGASGITRAVKPASRTTDEYEQSVKAAGAQVNAMAAGLLNELSPGLAATTQVLSVATRGLAAFGGAVGGAVGTVTVGLGALTLYVGGLKELTARQVDANLAVGRMDVGALVAGLQAAQREILILNGMTKAGLIGSYVSQFMKGWDEIRMSLGIGKTAAVEMVEAMGRLDKAYPFESARKLAAVDVQRLDILRATAALSQATAERLGRVSQGDAAAVRQLDIIQQTGLAKAYVIRLESDLQRALLVTAGASAKVLESFDKVRDAAIETEHSQTRLAVATGKEAIAAAQKARLEARIGPSDVSIFGGGDEKSLFGGFRDIEALTKDVGIFKAEIIKLAKDGKPASALFDEIARAQTRVDKTIAALKEKYADFPLILEEVTKQERLLADGGFTKDLDQQVRSLQNLSQGGYESVVMFREAKVAMDASATAFDAVEIRVITLTDRWYDLARAVHAATLEMILNTGIAGSGQTSAITGPGQ